MEVDEGTVEQPAPNPTNPESHDPSHDQSYVSSEPEPEKEWERRLRFAQNILSGKLTISLHQEFLIRNNHTDLQILKNTKDVSRGSICHNSTIIANGLMHYGTTSDTLLRENLEWLKKASNWAKFTATASLGLVHWGHEKEALNLMASYLPKDSANSSPYAEGGGLYAIGLIHANHGLKVMDYLANELRSNTSEIVCHGACLGLGLAAMGTANYDIYDLLKENLMTRDDAVVGEAAGLAMGLVMIGNKSTDSLEDMLNYARDTQHEKIQRGLALGISMLWYGQMDEADILIEELCRDKDPLLRRSGMFTVAMAYCGSGNNGAIRRLLHVAVSDVDNDVRRAAVTGLGFILFRNPEQCPHVVSLLSESFNAHVRCGAAMALGISCAGTGNKEALAVIDPLLKDSIPFVQQAAQIASAMILIQHTEAMNSRVAGFRQHYAKVSADKLEDSLSKFGAILAQGIIDAGGRNVTISLQSRTGHMSMKTAVGLLVFCQFWYWFPFCHFLSLAFTPTAAIGLNSDLKMPKLTFRSNAKPSLYAYPPPLEEEKKKEREKVATAVLSVTAKAKARKKAAGSESMDVETSGDKKEASSDKMDTASTTQTASEPEENRSEDLETTSGKPTGEDMEVEDEAKAEGGEEGGEKKKQEKEAGGEGEGKEKEKTEPEPDFQILSNPARVLPQQLNVLSWDESDRYRPLKPITVGGILMLKNSDSEAPEDLIEPLKVTVPGRDEDEGPEPSPPEPFEWSEDM
ncbi:26S proteasome non-ATPase regulatory subunit 1 [Geodia barretti]|nr:26S proteasome non-ATPase regulatory subunit 1 [Geodia barretti]